MPKPANHVDADPPTRESRAAVVLGSPLFLAWTGAIFAVTFLFVAAAALVSKVGIAVWLPIAILFSLLFSGFPLAYMWPTEPDDDPSG